MCTGDLVGGGRFGAAPGGAAPGAGPAEAGAGAAATHGDEPARVA